MGHNKGMWTALSALSLFAVLGSPTAHAQVESASAASCPKPTYTMQVGRDGDKTPLTITLNGQSLPLGRTENGGSKSVTALMQPQNRIQVVWDKKKPNYDGKLYDVPVTLNVQYGARVTPLVTFHPALYPNQRQFAYRFSAPPAQNIACDANQYRVELGYSAFGPFEWTVAVDGKTYLYALGDAKLDLRPFLHQGDNNVTVTWRVIATNGTISNPKMAQVLSTVGGVTKSLLDIGFKNLPGSSGSKSVVVQVP